MDRGTRRTRAALAAAVVMLAFVPASSRATGACEDPRPIQGIGLACEVDGGYSITLPDGLELFTHGFDALPAVALAKMGEPRKPRCVKQHDEEFHHEVLYVRPQGQRSAIKEMRGELRQMVAQSNGMMWANARLFNRKVELRFACAGGDVLVREVVLPTNASETRDFSTIVTGVRLRGYTSSLAKYWIWYDGKPEAVGSAAGIGTFRLDDRLMAENRNNVGPSYAATFGLRKWAGGAFVMLHENGHNMGAVQNSAPHSTRAGHCTDGSDVMCYNDGGSLGFRYDTSTCYVTQYDCGHDDYFNPVPEPGTWIATHWNVASIYNRFVEGCVYHSGVAEVGTGPAPVDGISSAGFRIPDSCDGHRYALSGVVVRPDTAVMDDVESVSPLVGAAASLVNPVTPVPDFNVCFFKGSKELACHDRIGTDFGSIPRGATRAVVTLSAGAHATYVFNAI